MHKYQLLRLRAEELRVMLEKYAAIDSDVADFLRRWMPWYERIQRREIRLPCYEYRLGIYFANPDLSPLAERYGFAAAPHPLSSAEAKFGEAIGDWLSDPLYLARMKASGESPDIALDEPPPPEEETPLAEPPKEPEKQGWLKAFFFGRK